MRFRLTQEDLALAFEWFETTDARLRQVIGAILLLASASVFCPGMDSQTPIDPHKMTDWFCSSLEVPFDFSKLTKTFPFDPLGEVTTARTPVQGQSEHSESTSTSIQQTAQGEKFIVIYSYQYNNSDVSSPYGFSIQVRPKTVDFNQDPDVFPKLWLNSIGKEEFQVQGPVVGMGEKAPYIGYSAYFQYWPATGTMLMNWMIAGDVSKFSAICKKTDNESHVNALMPQIRACRSDRV